MKFYPIDIKSADWKRLDQFADRTVFQTREWLQFIAESQNALPVLAELRESSDVLGYFTGLTFSKFGMKVLGSSFPGWTTPYIGFNLNPGVPRRAALEALEKFAWDDLKCLHLEVSDPYFTFEDGENAGFKTEYYASYRTDLTRSEEDLFNGMESACRRCIRKADKSGLKIEEAHDLAFADEYYEQLKDVFAKQSLVPTYSVERVRALVRNVEPVRQYLADSSARSGEEVHRHRNLSRLQPDRRVLGQRQLPFPSEPAPQRSLPLVRHALLEKARRHRSSTGAAKARTKKNTDARRIACPGSPSLVIRSWASCATRLAPCLRASKNFSDGCKATAPPPTAARRKSKA